VQDARRRAPGNLTVLVEGPDRDRALRHADGGRQCLDEGPELRALGAQERLHPSGILNEHELMGGGLDRGRPEDEQRERRAGQKRPQAV
jgi:hypothetical protein